MSRKLEKTEHNSMKKERGLGPLAAVRLLMYLISSSL